MGSCGFTTKMHQTQIEHYGHRGHQATFTTGQYSSTTTAQRFYTQWNEKLFQVVLFFCASLFSVSRPP